jgi:hypothetical protein
MKESDKTEKGRRPRGTGDDPFTIKDLDNDSDDSDPSDDDEDDERGTTGHVREVRLEGIPPDRFTGDRSRTLDFLSEFDMYMMMNMGSAIEKNPFKKTSYFLSLIGGPKAQGWKNRMIKYAKTASCKPSMLPYRMDIWDVAEAEFKKAFLDYAEHERASDDLAKLRMKDGLVDEYIAAFEDLAFRANIGLNEPQTLRMFGRGLPLELMRTCIRLESPENFGEWVGAAQKQHKLWLRERAYTGNYDQRPQNNNNGNRGRGFFWNSTGQGRPANQNNSSNNWRGNNAQAPRPRLPPRDPNAMDIGKAVTESQKEQHRKEGRCFRCSKRGHLARECPDRDLKIRTAETKSTNDETETIKVSEIEENPSSLAAAILALSELDREVFIKAMQAGGEDMGFVDA